MKIESVVAEWAALSTLSTVDQDRWETNALLREAKIPPPKLKDKP